MLLQNLAYFDQRLECTAPKHWLKYTIGILLPIGKVLQKIALILLFKKNRFNSVFIWYSALKWRLESDIEWKSLNNTYFTLIKLSFLLFNFFPVLRTSNQKI